MGAVDAEVFEETDEVAPEGAAVVFAGGEGAAPATGVENGATVTLTKGGELAPPGEGVAARPVVKDDVVAIGVAVLLVVETGAIKLGEGHRGSVRRGGGTAGSGATDGVHEGCVQLDAFVGLLPELAGIATPRPMEQPERDTLLLCDLDRRMQVCITCEEGHVRDAMLAAQERDVEPQEQIHALLLKDRPTIQPLTPLLQAPFPQLESGEGTDCVRKPLVARHEPALLDGRGIALVRRARVEVRTDVLQGSVWGLLNPPQDFAPQSLVVDARPTEVSLTDSVDVSTINEDRETRHFHLLGQEEGRRLSEAPT